MIQLTKNLIFSHYDLNMPETGECRSQYHICDPRSEGFSTIEILLIAALASIVLAAAVPQIRQSLSSYRLSSAAEKLSSELSMARMLAISRNAILEVQIDEEEGLLQLIDPDDPENPPRAPRRLEPGVTFSATPSSPIRFFSRGHARAGTLVIQNDSGESVSIEVKDSGFIEMSEFQHGD